MLATASRVSRRAVGARVSALFDEHAGMVLGLCRLLLRDHHEAEDAAQQTFVSAYRSLLRGTEPREPGPWLAAIARNECRARLRKRARAPLALDGDIELELSDSADLAEVADRRAELSALATEIAKLPSRQREAIALRDFLGLSYEEVASTLKVSVPVVESLLFRARRRLRDTVRTVPRYAAGLVVVPIALRAAVERDVPGFDTLSIGIGVGVAGAAAASVAKLVSLPASVKVAATVAVLATGSFMGPKLLEAPPHQGALPAPALVQGNEATSGDPVEGSAPAVAAPERAAQTAPEAVSSSVAAEASPATAPIPEATQEPAAPVPPAAEEEDEGALDEGRISSGAEGGSLPPPPPPPAEEPCEQPSATEPPAGGCPVGEPVAPEPEPQPEPAPVVDEESPVEEPAEGPADSSRPEQDDRERPDRERPEGSPQNGSGAHAGD